MSGKLPILIVLGLGLVASMCAAVLMAAMRAGGADADAAPRTVQIFVARGDLPGMTRLEEGLLEAREVDITEKPEGAFTDSVQILGRVIKNDLVAGQPILDAVLLSDEGGAQLASSLPSGMRAVSVEINSSSAMRGLLFPGCRVDVIVAYKLVGGRAREGSPVSRTLLQNVSVLAVEDKTVFTTEPEEGEDDKKSMMSTRRPSKGLMVTLMVDPQQARELQSARDLGELSLSLRNPLDDTLTADPSSQEPEAFDDALAFEVEATPEPTGPWKVTVVRGDKTDVVVFDGDGDVAGDDGRNRPAEDEPRYVDVPLDDG